MQDNSTECKNLSSNLKLLQEESRECRSPHRTLLFIEVKLVYLAGELECNPFLLYRELTLMCRRRKTVGATVFSLSSIFVHHSSDAFQKCDGARPVCSQCARSGRSQGCEYSDSQQHFQTEVLEENLALLRNRLEQLKHPNTASDAVLLHDPYASHKQTGQAKPETHRRGPELSQLLVFRKAIQSCLLIFIAL